MELSLEIGESSLECIMDKYRVVPTNENKYMDFQYDSPFYNDITADGAPMRAGRDGSQGSGGGSTKAGGRDAGAAALRKKARTDTYATPATNSAHAPRRRPRPTAASRRRLDLLMFMSSAGYCRSICRNNAASAKTKLSDSFLIPN